jgi:hypothetical protein
MRIKSETRLVQVQQRSKSLGSNLEQTMSKTFGYKLPGYFMEYGPVTAGTLDEAKAKIRQKLGVSRLPWGLQIWDLAERPLARWRVAQAS